MAFLNPYRLLLSALLVAGIALFAGQAQAGSTPIPIVNFSFESPISNNAGTLCANTATNIPGWTCSSTTLQGVYAPDTTNQYPLNPTNGTGTPTGAVPDGTQAAFMARSGANQTLTQTTSATYVAGQTYTLTAWAGRRADSAGTTWGPNNFIELLGLGLTGDGVVSQIVSDPGQGNWIQVQLTYTAVANDNGKTISVGLLGDTNGNRVQINWDDIHLTVPEPSTLLLLAMGFGSFALIRRKRKNPA